MKQKDLLIYASICSAIAAILLFYAIGDRQYGYYQFLRVAIFGTGIFTAYVSYLFRAHVIVVGSVIFAILFNPLSIVTMDKSTWQLVDLVACLYYLAAAITFAWQLKKDKQ